MQERNDGKGRKRRKQSKVLRDNQMKEDRKE